MNDLSGYRLDGTAAPREIFYSTVGQQFLPGGIVLDGTNARDGANVGFEFEIRAGWWLGQITASKLWRPCTRTTAVGAGVTSAALTVVNAAAFLAGDNIKIGAVAATILSINYATNVITLTATKSWADLDVVIGQDGSQIARGINAEFARLRNFNNTVYVPKSSVLAIAGEMWQEYLLGDTAAILADTGALLKDLRMISAGILTS